MFSVVAFLGMVLLEPSLLQAEVSQLSQTVLIGKVLQPSEHLHDLLQKIKQSEVIPACTRNFCVMSSELPADIPAAMRATALPRQSSWWPQPAAEVSVPP